ncbi:hypothetical protein WDU94_012804 [Cyamophila willieti]
MNLLSRYCNEHRSMKLDQDKHTCDMCKVSFSDKRILQAHINIEHGNSHSIIKCYLCQICCDQLYRDAHLFQEHLVRVHEDRESNLDKFVVDTVQDLLLPCKTCDKACLLFSGFCNEHDEDDKCRSESKCGDGAHECAACTITFTDCVLLWRHKFSEHDTWQCNLCATSILSPRHLTTHWMTEHQPRLNFTCHLCDSLFSLKEHCEKKEFTCVVCGASYALWKRLREHCLRKHTVFVKTILPNNEQLVPTDLSKSSSEILDDQGLVKYKCNACDKTFAMYSGLMRHIQSDSCSTLENILICSYCKQTFSQKKNLSQHYRTVHGILLRSNVIAEMKLECGITIDGVTSYKCPHCPSLFLRFFSLQKHLKSHSGVRPFTCTVCNKSFALREHLTRHSNIHTGRGYQCNVCGRFMSDKTNLKVHMRNHTGEKKYICEVCGKGFAQWSSHYYHMFTHSESRNFRCSLCEKTFQTPAGLREHKRVHVTSDEKHICETCGNSFSSRKNLLSHVKIHTTERAHKCEYCSATFKRRKYLVQHYKTHLKVNK